MALALVAVGVWLLLAGRGNAFHGDELYYYAHLVAVDGVPTTVHGIEYVLAPHNAHGVIAGRLAYEVLFELVGTDYFWFRLVEVIGVLACATLLFLHARRLVSPWLALAFGLSLLTVGSANETLMWPFDLHTVYAAALGLGAIFACERGDRRGDALACGLLTLSVATLEVGLAFAVGVAVSVLLRADRLRRLWIFLVPVALYLAWSVWARKFGQSAFELENVTLIPSTAARALAAVLGSLLGLNPRDLWAGLTGISAAAWVAAAAAVAALVLRIRRGGLAPAFWVFLATALAYWGTMAMGARAPDSTRYIFVGSLLVLLVAVEALRGLRLPRALAPVAFLVVAFAFWPNLEKLNDGRRSELRDAAVLRAELGMLDLAGPHSALPGYAPSTDARVGEAYGYLGVGLDTTNYFHGAAEYGELGMSVPEVRAANLEVRHIADASLVGAYAMGLREVTPPPNSRMCPSVTDASAKNVAYFELDSRGALLGAISGPVEIDVSRFVRGLPGVKLGDIERGDWVAVDLPRDRAPDPWRAVVDGPVRVCPLR
jgi:hypothetical protein